MKGFGLNTKVLKQLALCVPILTSSCCSIKPLTPAFDANKRNIEDMRGNVTSVVILLELTADSVFKSRLELQTAAVCDSILLEFTELGFDPANVSGTQVERILTDQSTTIGKRLTQLGNALASSEDSRRKQLQSQQPVLAALIGLQITATQVAEDYAKLLNARSNRDIKTLRWDVAKKYPLLQETEKANLRWNKTLAAYKETLLKKQLPLAAAHADLFDYAAKSDLDVSKAFAKVIGDDALQSQILGSVHDPKTKEALSEGFSFMNEFLTEHN